MPVEIIVNRAAFDFIKQKVSELNKELPDLRLGYLDNISDNDFDDKGWSVFLPFHGREESYFDRVYLGETIHLHNAVTRWHIIEAQIRENYAKGKR